jgi:hypothetical protein
VRTVRLGFRAFDPHELLVHFVAQRTGLYREREVHVELADLRAGERPHDATCACGTVLFQALAGAPVEILLIASAAPLFWLYGHSSALDGARIATYPPGAPPARFLELALDGPATFVPARDDAARLALVSGGGTDCALVSSATPAPRVPDGLTQLFCLADRILVPSTGVAAPRERGPAVERLAEAHRRALARLAGDRPLAQATARESFGFSDEEAAWVLDAVARHFTADGRVPAAYIDAALSTVGASRSPYAAGAVSLPATDEEDLR